MAAPLKATFFAFHKRDRGGVLLSTTLMFALFSALVMAAAVLVNINFFIALFTAISNNAFDTVDPGSFGIGMVWLLLSAFIFLFVFYVLMAAYEAACLRWMIHGEHEGVLGLSLGAPTWRVYSGYWVWLGIQWAVSTVVSLVSMPFMFFAIAGAGGAADPNAMMGPMFIFQIVTALLQYAILAFIGVRFAPAAATSIARRKFSFFKAWAVTRGRFWALFGSFFLVGLIWVLVGAVLFVAAGGAAFVELLPLMMNPNPDPAETSAAFARLVQPPLIWILLAGYAVSLFIGLIFQVLFYGINARAVLVAIEEGKVDGVTTGLASTFE